MNGFRRSCSLSQVNLIFCICFAFYISATNGLFWNVAEATKLPDAATESTYINTLSVQKKPSYTSLSTDSSFAAKSEILVHSQFSHLYPRLSNDLTIIKKRDSSTKNDQINLSGGMNTAAYFAELSVGTPAQNFRLDVDTGSTMMIIVGKDCVVNNTGNRCGHVKGDSGYDGSLSKSTRNVTCTEAPECSCNHGQCYFYAAYGDNSKASGWIVNDVVQLGDFSVPAYFTNVRVEQGTTSTSGLTDERMDGILGLAFPFLGDNLPGVFDLIVQNYTQVSNVFSMCFGSENGLLFLGGYNDSHINGSVNYTPITVEMYYSVHLAGIQVQNQIIPYPSQFNALVDSGTTGLYLPQEVYSSVMSALQSRCQESDPPRLLCGEHNIFTIKLGECLYFNENELAELPELSFLFPSADDSSNLFPATISGRDYIEYFTTDSIKWDFCGMLMILPSPLDQAILGDSFMRGMYTIFDRDNRRIGFAKPSNCGNNLSTKKRFPVLVVVLLGIFGLFLLIMLGALIRCCIQRRKKRLAKRYIEESTSLIPTSSYRNNSIQF